MITALMIIKIVAIISIVLSVSIIAERSGMRLAGIIAGLPTVSGLTMIFYGIEIGPKFAAESAMYNLLGLIATQFFLLFYVMSAKRIKSGSRILQVMLCSAISLAGYSAIAFLIRNSRFLAAHALISSIASVMLFLMIFRRIADTKVMTKTRLGLRTILLRCSVAAIFIIATTEIAKSIPASLAGLISSAPATLFPLMIILHFTYGAEHAMSFAKNVPFGISSVIVYSFSVSLTYAGYGVMYGSLISLVLCLIYLVLSSYARTLVPRGLLRIIYPFAKKYISS